MMKKRSLKNRFNLSKTLVIYISIISLIIYSCKKTESVATSEIEESTASIKDIVVKSISSRTVKGKPLLGLLNEVGMNPDWTKARDKKNSKQKTVIGVPLERTFDTYSELNSIVTSGITQSVIKKYTTLPNGSVRLDFYSLNGKLLKTGSYYTTTKKFRVSRVIPKEISLFVPNGSILEPTRNNPLGSKDKLSVSGNRLNLNLHKTAGGNPGDDEDDDFEDGGDLDEVVIEGDPPPTEDPFDRPDLDIPDSPPGGPTDYYPVDPVVPGPPTSTTENVLLFDTINHVTDTCILKALDKALGKNAGTKIKNLMALTFLGAKASKVEFYAFPFTSNANTEAIARVLTKIEMDISFNTNSMPNRSLEYNVATIYHEILHCYLGALFGTPGFNNIVPSDHTYIAENYITMLSADLRTLFPSMSAEDAKNLAWGGLEKTNLFSIKTAEFQKAVSDTNKAYATKPGTTSPSKGSFCR